MRSLVIVAALLLAACASGPGVSMGAGGVASYDALKAARDACVARGGELKLDRLGNSQRMSSYSCKRK
jgi:hypothetical protein